MKLCDNVKLFICAFVAMFLCTGFIEPFQIRAEKNAFLHNNKGVAYLKENMYYAAVKEFQIAISINPETQASSTFYNNLGTTYLKIGYPKQAEQCFNDAIKYSPMNFTYYQNLVNSYKQQNVTIEKLASLQNDKNPLSKVKIALIYIENGDKQTGIKMLKSFTKSEPDLIITNAINNYLNPTTQDL